MAIPPPGALRFPATRRNRDPIRRTLARVLPEAGLVLEVASGSGEHAVFLAAAFPRLGWQPSDPDPRNLASIRAWAGAASPRRGNLRPPLGLDARDDPPPLDSADAVVCINMIHVAPWGATEGLMRMSARLLPDGGPLYLYGPFTRGGAHEAPSNAAFDAGLRRENEAWGVRDLGEVAAEARRRGLFLAETAEMPANNLSVVFRKDGRALAAPGRGR